MDTHSLKKTGSLLMQRQEDAYYQLMRALFDNPELSQRELARTLGMSLGKLNYCIKALADKGWIKINNFSQAKNKLKYVYLLTPRGVAEKAKITQHFLQRKLQEYDALKAEIEILQAEMRALNDVE